MSEIQNTTAAMQDPNGPDLLALLGVGMATGSADDFIYAQERAGQRQLVRSQMLPTELQHPDTVADFEALGFTFGDPDPSDPMFRPVALPEGWSKRGSDHDMWSDVVDGLARARVAVFYKAAWYDRKAFMRLVTVDGYLWTCIADRRPVLSDDSWATPAAIVDAATKYAASRTEDIARYRGFIAAGRDGDDYWAERIPEVEAERGAALAIAAQFGGAS